MTVLLENAYELITIAREIGAIPLKGHLDERDREAVKRRAVRRLEEPGYRVEVALLAAPAG